MNAPAIEAHGLRKAFGQVTALVGLSFQVPQGSLLDLAFTLVSARTYARMGR